MRYIKPETFLMVLITIIGFFSVRTLNSVDESLGSVTKSVNNLNENMAKVVTELSYQRRDIDVHSIEIKEIKEHIHFKK